MLPLYQQNLLLEDSDREGKDSERPTVIFYDKAAEEKIPCYGEFTQRSDPWAGLIASRGSFYPMVLLLLETAAGLFPKELQVLRLIETLV